MAVKQAELNNGWQPNRIAGAQGASASAIISLCLLEAPELTGLALHAR